MKELVVVTGGAGYLGRSIAKRLGQGDRIVALLDIDDQALSSAVEELNGHGVKTSAIQVNVLDAEKIRQVANKLQMEFGPARVIVTAVGYSPKVNGMKPETLKITEDEWKTVLDVNLTSVFFTLSAFLPGMIKARTGRIVTIASTAALVGSPTAGAHYCAAKAGLIGLTKSIAVEYAPYGILINAVAPGKVENPNWGDAERERERYISSVPIGRLATADEISEVIAFLASERNTYITGKVITIDGGRIPL
jgi:NAD(P)-dependent dehydrogenase (short-subunit alcohol dehydrogenase family)